MRPDQSASSFSPWCLALVLVAPLLASAASFETGRFTKSVAAAPAVQRIPHGLGETPVALVLWTSGATTVDAIQVPFSFAMGVSDGATSRSVGMACSSGVSPARASRVVSTSLLHLVQPGASTRASATLVGWDATSFTLQWDVNDAQANLVNFVVLGGAEVHAKVVDFVVPAAPGTLAVTQMGFRPSALLTFHAGGFTGALDTPAAGAAFGLGGGDAKLGQWSDAVVVVDGSAPLSGASLATATSAVSEALPGSSGQAAVLTSMDADGFTLTFRATPKPGAHDFALGLTGLQATAGKFQRTATNGPEAVTSAGFRPEQLFAVTPNDALSGTSSAGMSLGLGAATAAVQLGSGTAAASDNTSHTLMGSQLLPSLNNTGALEWDVRLDSLDATGFTGTITNYISPKTDGALYLALATVPTALPDGGMLPDGGVAGGGSTGPAQAYTVGCSCQGAPGERGGLLTALLVLAAIVARRGRGHSTAAATSPPPGYVPAA